MNLKIGDTSENGQITIIDEDRLCYLVKSASRGAEGIRTISKSLLLEYIAYFSKNPNASANDARDTLSGQSDIDKFEYGYTSTLKAMAQMELGQIGTTSISIDSIPDRDLPFPLQQIFYGAPGTGKSHGINKETQGKSVIRTTFHPDSDYSTFVGAYKPIVDDESKKITYGFVKQAFVQAYICAWEKYSKASVLDGNSSLATASTSVSSSPSGQFAIGDTVFRVTQVSEDRVKVQKDINLKKQSVLTVWKRSYLWINGEFTLPKGPQSGVSLQYSVCKWIYDNLDKPSNTEDSFEEGWKLLMDELNKGQVSMSSLSQIYTATKINNNTDEIHISWELNSRKLQLEKCFNGVAKSVGAQRGLVNILKNLNSESFADAWDKLRNLPEDDNHLSDDIEIDGIMDNIESNVTIDPVYLIIEEINRGNCAQIFGDLFQLLDRNDAGYSSYAINADTDLANELHKCLSNVKLDRQIENYINSLYEEHYDDIVKKVLDGEILLLPNNLYIWATMNTSDQSLFPIDSAFKRRWDWKYVPIDTAKESWVIKVNGKEYSWTSFLNIINEKIYAKTQSEDKQLGFYFCKAERDVISAERLVSKVLFYVYNDVFKDYGFDDSFFNSDNGKLTFQGYYKTDGKINEEKVAMFLDNLEVEEIRKNVTED